MAAFKASDFLAEQLAKRRELGQMQRHYKNIVTTNVLTRSQGLNQKGCDKARECMRAERDELRAKIWVAESVNNRRENNVLLKNIKCQLECQEYMTEDILKAKVGIKNLEREIGRTNKLWLQLNRQTVPETQHMAFVHKTRKKLEILESELEVAMHRECISVAENVRLREQLVLENNNRCLFNELYTKAVLRLHSDKKYLIELVEYAIGIFDNGISMFEKTSTYKDKHHKEGEQHRRQVDQLLRKTVGEANFQNFLNCKEKERELADLQPKEYRRREEFRRRHLKKIKTYNDVVEKIKSYTLSPDFETVIAKFKDQESLYYSYFNYANEMGYHVTLLGNSVERLYAEIKQLKLDNNLTLNGQQENMYNLQDILYEKRQKNIALKKKSDENELIMGKILDNIGEMFEMSGADGMSLMQLLGDNSTVNLGNARHVLKLLENRLLDVIAAVYVDEHQTYVSPEYIVVNDVEKERELPTELKDIVLTQQCAECAEGEATNIDEAASDMARRSPTEIRKKLYEKIVQPEMQYRLHSISQCRLPRSRMLAAKRNA